MDTIRVGVFGVGIRGHNLLQHVLDVENVKVTAICDIYEERIERAVNTMKEKGAEPPVLCTANYHELIACDEVDVVMIFAAWEAHIPAAIEAMRAGKPVGVEVAGAYSIDQCWEVVKVYEETKTPIMMLENCCYGRRELMLLNMVKQGFFGKIAHMDGSYCHDLREEIIGGNVNKHYRLRNYMNRNCENYPTHELGPIAKILGINRGNRMVSLTSTASKAVGLHDYVEKHHSDDKELMDTVFTQGDIITTVIKCAHGETIKLTLGTTLPRFYSRGLAVHGTDAFFEEASRTIARDGDFDEEHEEEWLKENLGNEEKYREKYEHPIWVKYIADGVKEGHGGMDWLTISAFFHALKNGEPMPIDVYDMAAWMAITPLTERSIQMGSMPVEIPDFTNGKWVVSFENKSGGLYSLETIPE
ncbi:MAG: Gfo/Idh/MocA family oxidoreductase [Ruminococcaceae bacterium]|nr:Gfo/Idh/MocA family oxidoreductase [Oscillospiraceae bacterium]